MKHIKEMTSLKNRNILLKGTTGKIKSVFGDILDPLSLFAINKKSTNAISEKSFNIIRLTETVSETHASIEKKTTISGTYGSVTTALIISNVYGHRDNRRYTLSINRSIQ